MHLHKLLSLRFALATAAMSLMLSTNSFALNVTVVQGQSCPANTTLLGYQEAEANKAGYAPSSASGILPALAAVARWTDPVIVAA
ncbi:hypothetical protein [Massilia genomosp. 1]|uniref:Uncharacterized protein n=1 Tax=Massilia genomosp. 1 TaxID=2609280 RepID=A0ABX0N126_9BURK|nr:hypothetical protein [Massilia genomosp. 1]NHZ66063.1 hypothetical protein [Massilia genomosp. 1]